MSLGPPVGEAPSDDAGDLVGDAPSPALPDEPSHEAPLGRRPFYALSLGAGVNSTALLLLAVRDGFPLDEVVFANTGAEKPETYAYLQERIVPFLRAKGIAYREVRAKETLIDRCIRGHTIPDRRYRWSTRDYKIRPIYKHLKPKAPVVCYLGIAYDEAHRVKQEHQVDWLRREWPLIDAKMTRTDCVKLIESEGWPIPPKSGCWFCPFQKVGEWRDLLRDHPELYRRAIEIEKNGSKYPEFALIDGGLTKLRDRFRKEERAANEQSSLDGYIEECEGFCLT